MDGTLSGGKPKMLELTNCSDSSVDLSAFRVAGFFNGSTSESPSSMDYGDMTALLAPGDTFVIVNPDSNPGNGGEFFSVYGFEPELYDTAINGNGNDVYMLYQNDGFGGDIAWDVYGVVGEPTGSGDYTMVWAYQDGYSYSLPGRAPNGGVFNPGNWYLAGVDALEGAGASGIAALTTAGQHTCLTDVEVYAAAGGCTAVVTYDAPTATDNCDPAPAVSCDWPSGSTFPSGTTTVTCTAEDSCGNESTCSFDVTVLSVSEMVLDLELSPTVASPLTRCITFELWKCPATSPAATVNQEITFVGGMATGLSVEVPCGSYTCVTARDELAHAAAYAGHGRRLRNQRNAVCR